MKFILRNKIEIALFLILAVAYFVIRLPNLTLQPIFADEAIYIRWAQVMKSEPTLRFLPLSDGKTPLFMWLMIPFFKVFKDPLLAGRFLSITSGFFTLLGVFFLTKKVFNLKSAFWAVLFYVITPYIVFFDRMALVDSMLSAFTIWIIYFALWLVQNPRLDLAMILGYLMGGAILTKTPGLINILILPLSAIVLKRENRNSFLGLVLFWGVAIVIALVMYNALRLGPEFNKLSSRNADYVFSPYELKGRLLDPFIPHFHDISDWFPKLLTIPTLLFIGIGIFYSFRKLNSRALVILIWVFIPVLVSMAFLKTFTARYLLASIPPSLIFAGFGLVSLIGRIKMKNLVKILLALVIILPLSLKFDYQLLTNPPPDSLPKAERRGYFEDWTAGYGFKEIASYLIEQKKNGSVVVGTDGFFGTLPDGLHIYLDKANIAVVGSSATISAQLRDSAKEHLTFFVMNKKRLVGGFSEKDAKLIKEYLKAKSLDNSFQDGILFYKVLAP